MARNWFDVDKAGLAKLIDSTNKGRLIAELIQNSLDENVTTVQVRMDMVPGKPLCEVVVRDDSPQGFQNLAHAYTLFAESYKKGDAQKRGRFNLGEKLVLALCKTATIKTTTGTVIFDEDGRRTKRDKTEAGSEFSATIKMTRAEYEEAVAYLRDIIPPPNITVIVNSWKLTPVRPLCTFSATLPTEIADEEGVMRTRQRQTAIEVYEAAPGEAKIFEMGMPVVDIDCKWSINVHQKVPVTLSRDNVPPSYLRKLYALVLNEMADKLDKEEVNKGWVAEATASPEAAPEAIRRFADLKFGEKRASFDLSDLEANKKFVSTGGTIVTGSMLGADQWANLRKAEAIIPAGKLTPTPKPWSDDPNAQAARFLPESEWGDDVRRIASYAKYLAKELLGAAIDVRVSNDVNAAACYGPGELTFNLRRLGRAFFKGDNMLEIDALLIHEFAHHTQKDHLSSAYYDELCRLGAALKELALSNPGELRKYYG